MGSVAPARRSATPAASSSASDSQGPPPPPPRAAPFPGADLHKLVFVESVCAAAVNHLGGRIQVGCRACPPWDDPQARPDGRIVVDPDPFYRLHTVYLGSFTRPGAQQAALLLDGCEPIADGNGGTLIVEKSLTEWYWVPRGYHSGINPNQSIRLELSDRDILAAQDGLATGYESTDLVYTYDFKERKVTRLFGMHHQADGVCHGQHDRKITNGSIQRFEVVDSNRDGLADLRVHLRYASITVTKALEAKIGALCAQLPANAIFKNVDPDKYMKASLVSLDFVQAGGKLAPTQATRKWLQDVGAELP